MESAAANAATATRSVSEVLSEPTMRIVVSCILGFGLATLFRRMCTSNSCLIIKGPNAKHTQSFKYKVADGECYTYTQVPVKCL